MDAEARADATRFEQLCLLRELYTRRAERDRVGIMSMRDAMRYAEVLLSSVTPPPAERSV